MQNTLVSRADRMDDITAAIIKNIAEILLGLGGLGGLATIIGQWIARRKANAEAAEIEAKTSQQVPANAAASLVDTSNDVIVQYKNLLKDYQLATDEKIGLMRSEVVELKQTLSHYAKRIAYLMSGIQMLGGQVVALGHKPVWTPNDWKADMDRRASDEKADLDRRTSDAAADADRRSSDEKANLVVKG
jgi:hypothetical protein